MINSERKEGKKRDGNKNVQDKEYGRQVCEEAARNSGLKSKTSKITWPLKASS